MQFWCQKFWHHLAILRPFQSFIHYITIGHHLHCLFWLYGETPVVVVLPPTPGYDDCLMFVMPPSVCLLITSGYKSGCSGCAAPSCRPPTNFGFDARSHGQPQHRTLVREVWTRPGVTTAGCIRCRSLTNTIPWHSCHSYLRSSPEANLSALETKLGKLFACVQSVLNWSIYVACVCDVCLCIVTQIGSMR